MTRASRPAFVVLALSASLCCAGGRAWTRVDPWYAPAPATLPHGQEIESSQVFLVTELHKAETSALLEDVSVKAIDVGQATEWVGADLAVPAGYRAFLVRGVYLNRSHFTVRRADSALHVHASSLGRHAVPMKQQPLVVLLLDRPVDVYVTCSMAE